MTVTDHIHQDRTAEDGTALDVRPSFIDDDDSRRALLELLAEAGVRPTELRRH